jgi:hypothetical protein
MPPGNVISFPEWATLRMKDTYSGNYTVEEYLDKHSGTAKFRLKFDSPVDETFFSIKWS